MDTRLVAEAITMIACAGAFINQFRVTQRVIRSHGKRIAELEAGSRQTVQIATTLKYMSAEITRVRDRLDEFLNCSRPDCGRRAHIDFHRRTSGEGEGEGGGEKG